MNKVASDKQKMKFTHFRFFLTPDFTVPLQK